MTKNGTTFVFAWQATTQLQLPTIYWAETQSSEDFMTSFENNTFVGLSDMVYVGYE